MRSTKKKAAIALSLLCIAASVAVAQNPAGEVGGWVKGPEGSPLPGVTITANSPRLQGSRVAVSDANGVYVLRSLPPGTYTLSYELDGLTDAVRQVKVSAAQKSILNIAMQIAGVAEEIVVISNEETISGTSTVAQTITSEELDKLGTFRTPLTAVKLAPGVADTGPASSPVIHGAFSYENLYLVNGVVVSENVRGSFLPLFIEDAIQETTTTTAGVSAEYGRFSGGVVNVITKSGGNEVSGSLRATMDSESWVSDKNAKKFDPDIELDDTINETFELTAGGPIWKDKIWWFGAGRDRESSYQGITVATNISFPRTSEQQRYEFKATVSPAQGHTVIGSYLGIDSRSTGSTFGSVMDLRSVNNRTDPQDLSSVNYSGILTPNFFLEAQFSERNFEVATGLGGPPDLIEGTMLRHRPTGRRFWASTFCGSCEPEMRDNENRLAKGSYFLTTAGSGTHDITFGYDTFSDIRFSVNHQTGSDFQVWAEDIHIDSNNNIFPIFQGSTTWVVWWPPVGLEIAQPTDFETNSVYMNDSWQLNDRWSFNVGARYDQNDGIDSSGQLVTDDSKVSPRLGLTFDVTGDGDFLVNASYGTYVAAIANSGNVADSASTGGALAGFFSFYLGPQVNTNCPPDCVTSDVALQTLFGWYFGQPGGITAPDVNQAIANRNAIPGLFYSSIPGATSQIREGLKSPSTDEITVGVTKRLGNKGLLRADLIYREWKDFYSNRTAVGDTYDLDGDGNGDGEVIEIGNFGDNVLERAYIGADVQGRYRINKRLTTAGSYTWSKLEGNIEGETANSGPVPASPNTYPEFNLPTAWDVGPLEGNQTHKLRVWGIYDFIDNERHSLSMSLLQSFTSGTPYSDAIEVSTGPNSLTGSYIRDNFPAANAYIQTPAVGLYFPTGRGAYETDDVTRTDLSLTYSFSFSAFAKDLAISVVPSVRNIFDQDALTNPRTDTLYFSNGGWCGTVPCADFNALIETPERGVHYELGDFGQADSEFSFQTPRYFTVSVGFRF